MELRAPSKRLGADILVVPGGFTKNMEGALLRVKPSTSILTVLEQKYVPYPGFNRLPVSYLYGLVDVECCVFPVQFIGYEQSTDFVIHSWLPKQINRPV